MSKVGRGPGPSMTPRSRPGPKSASPKGGGARAPKAKAASGGRKSPGLSAEEAEEAAGFERHHAAELEEEGRRHTALEGEGELARLLEEHEDDDVVQGLNWDDERKKRGRQPNDDDDEDADAEAAAAAAEDAKKAGIVGAEGAGKYFQDMPEDRMGDMSLTDPNEMKRALGPSVRFAQHAMLLAEDRMKTGATRDDALVFLASIYTGVADRDYANKAMREFGHATGILDLYPLELMDALLEHVPGFCTKVRRGAFLTTTKVEGYESTVGEPIRLEYDPDLRIRGFAIKGGGRPGYLLEPTDPPGTYQLIFLSPGRFTVLLSAISKDGWVMIEELEVNIEASPEPLAFDDITGLRRERQADDGARAAAPDKGDKPEKDKKDDLKFHFPRRI